MFQTTESKMQDLDSESALKAPRPDERREITDAAFRQIRKAQTEARQAKSERLRQARMAAAVDS